jgi:hypothetical protein
VRIKNMISDEFEVCGLVKLGSSASNLTKSNDEVRNLSKSDPLFFFFWVVLMMWKRIILKLV